MHVEDALSIRQLILLHNLDANWPASDQKYIAQLIDRMVAGFQRFGFAVQQIAVRHDLSVLDFYDPRQWLVFNWCEGFESKPWSDALVAKGLEVRRFTFTGSDSKTLAIAQDKWQVKKILQAAGVPTPNGVILDEKMPVREWKEFPAIVKPINQHGSFGVTRDSVVESTAALIKQVQWVKDTFGCFALVEPFLNDREFQVAVWGNRKVQALPPMELDYSAFTALGDRLYTYDSKFDPNSAGWSGIKWYCPAPIDEHLRQELERVAVGAYRALRCRDYARFDIRLYKGNPMVIDVNPNPDLDPTSVFPAATEAIGLDYAAMAVRIVELAAVRMRRRLSALKTRQAKTRRFAAMVPA